jgi:acetate kinase
MKGSILAINSGSSSVKFASFDISPGAPPQRVLHGEVEGIGSAPRLLAWEHEGAPLEERSLDIPSNGSDPQDPTREHKAALGAILAWLAQHPSQGQPLAALHRVVHGGEQFTEPTLTSTSRACCRLTSVRSPTARSSLRTWATARACVPCSGARAWRRAWVSPPSTA